MSGKFSLKKGVEQGGTMSEIIYGMSRVGT